MANQPRENNPHRSVRVDDDLWRAAQRKAKKLGIPVAAPIRDALRAFIRDDYTQPTEEENPS